MTYTITNEIPITDAQANPYPFATMEPGDSFDVPLAKLRTVRSLASAYGIASGTHFSVRRYKDGYRCWRVS